MKVLKNEPLARHTNYKIGGKTPFLYIVETREELFELDKDLLKKAYILGAGTNILVSDKGIERPVIKIAFDKFFLEDDILTVEAGALLNRVAKVMGELGMEGLTHVSGIPGSVGGAIMMNASASHGAISDFLKEVEFFDKETKEVTVFPKNRCGFAFRKSIFQEGNVIITRAKFKIKPGNKKHLTELYQAIQLYRQKFYPSLPSAGCCFVKSWGGKDIIKKIDMVGKWNGGAVISPLFPAFILNTGDATANDVYSLIKEIQTKAEKIGENMPTEIIIWGSI